MWRELGVGVVLLWGAGCAQHEQVDLTGKDCPCGGGWVCETTTNTCVRGRGEAATDAGPRRDTGPLPDTGPGPVDSGGVDTGMMMMTSGTFWIEAESGTIEAPMQTGTDAAASGGSFVQVDPATAGSTAAAPPTGKVTFDFTVEEAGTYRVWGRVIAPIDANDSFWVRMDGGTWYQWNNLSPRTAWDWDDVHDSMMADALVTWDLPAGAHTLDIAYREPMAQLDKIVITNDAALVPTGAGE